MRSDNLTIHTLVEFLHRVDGLSRKAVWYLVEQLGSWERFLKTSQGQLLSMLPRLSEGPRQAFITALARRSDFIASPNFVSYKDPRYPERLHHLSDPPSGFFFRGGLEVFQRPRPWVGLVGTRMASPYALEVCARLVAQMKEFDPVIVSGLALGVDGMAHRAALGQGLKTLAVLGGSVEAIYPARHRELARRILQDEGLLISERASGTKVEKWHFPERNRLIAALCDAVVVVEAPEKSGALLTADFALDLGRELYAVPGAIDSDRNRGGHRLIQDGARLLLHGREIFVDLGLAKPRPESPKVSGPIDPLGSKSEPDWPPTLEPPERKLLEIIAFEPCHIDKIADMGHLPNPQVSGLLVQLSLKGLVEELPGQYFQLRALGRELLSNPES